MRSWARCLRGGRQPHVSHVGAVFTSKGFRAQLSCFRCSEGPSRKDIFEPSRKDVFERRVGVKTLGHAHSMPEAVLMIKYDPRARNRYPVSPSRGTFMKGEDGNTHSYRTLQILRLWQEFNGLNVKSALAAEHLL